MFCILCGPVCSGKSTLAKEIVSKQCGCQSEIVSGRDYLRLAKRETEAWQVFIDRVTSAASDTDFSEKSLFYVLSEISLLNKSLKDMAKQRLIRTTASPEILKKRFASRQGIPLSSGISAMIDRQYKVFDDLRADLVIDTGGLSLHDASEKITAYLLSL